MAKYKLTYSCGHAGQLELYGKESERQNRLTWLAKAGLCPDCMAIKMAEQDKAAAEQAKEKGRLALHGSKKQVTWAYSIRERLMTELEDMMPKVLKDKAELLDTIHSSLSDQDDATWWINHREYSLNMLLSEYIKKGGKKNA